MTPQTEPPEAPVSTTAWASSTDWQALPKRAYRVFLYVALLIAVPVALVVSLALNKSMANVDWRWAPMVALWVLALSFAFWVARKRYRYTFWKLDANGFTVRRGRLWQWETMVPTTRVQHLDVKRGPLERMHGLASLVLHTAGMRLSAVTISGIDETDAERLRDHFSHQIDRKDDDDDAGT